MAFNYPIRLSVLLKLPSTPSCTVEIIQHALNGQKLLAQGNALGINDIHLTPCKGKSFTYRRGFSFFIRCILKLLPLQGALLITLYPGRCPGLGASALSGRAAVGFLAFRSCCLYGLLAPLPLLYPSASDFQFRYAPVTVGSGRASVNFWGFACT